MKSLLKTLLFTTALLAAGLSARTLPRPASTAARCGRRWRRAGLLGLIWSPCSGPLLGSALTLVASEGGASRGALILGLFGLGAAIPLVAAAYASRAGFGRVRQWVLRHGEQSKKVFGALLLLVGVVILSGADKWLETQVNERLPDAWLLLTTRW